MSEYAPALGLSIGDGDQEVVNIVVVSGYIDDVTVDMRGVYGTHHIAAACG